MLLWSSLYADTTSFVFSIPMDTIAVKKSDIVTHCLLSHPFLIAKQTDLTGIPKLRYSENKTFIFLLSLVLLFLFSGIRILFPKYVSTIFDTLPIFSKRKKQAELESKATIWLSLFYFISCAFLVSYLLKHYSHSFANSNTVLAFMSCLGLLLLLFCIRYLLIKLVSWVFDSKDVANSYFKSASVVNEMTGIALFPFCIVLLLISGKVAYTLLVISAVIFCILLIYKYLRIYSGITNLLRINLFQFMLYLCAFEIIPILILCKIVMV